MPGEESEANNYSYHNQAQFATSSGTVPVAALRSNLKYYLLLGFYEEPRQHCEFLSSADSHPSSVKPETLHWKMTQSPCHTSIIPGHL